MSLVGEKLVIGFVTRATVDRLLEEGDITSEQVQRFQQAAVAFLERAVEYAMKKLPMKEPLLKHATFLDVQQRVWSGRCLLLCRQVSWGIKYSTFYL